MHELDRTLALPLWLRDPQWRWKLALLMRADPTRSINEFRSDASLYEAATFYRSICIDPLNHAYRRRQHADMMVAYAIWAGASLSATSGLIGRGSWRGLVEALLLTDLPFDQFGQLLGIDLSTRAVRLYHDVFFDVRSYLDSRPAVHINVLSCAEQKLTEPLQPERNCLLRLFAYRWGAEQLLNYFYGTEAGQSLAHSRWMRVVAGEALTMQVAQDALSQRRLYQEESINLFKVAQKNWEMPAASVDAVEDEIKKRFLHDTAVLLTGQLSVVDRLRADADLTREQAMEAARKSGFVRTPVIEV